MSSAFNFYIIFVCSAFSQFTINIFISSLFPNQTTHQPSFFKSGSVPKNEFKLSMGRLKWFDRFLTNEIVAQNRFLTRCRRKNRFLRPIKEITSTMGLSPEADCQVPKKCAKSVWHFQTKPTSEADCRIPKKCARNEANRRQECVTALHGDKNVSQRYTNLANNHKNLI